MLQTRRMLLRPPHARDLAALHSMMSDPLTMRYWSTDAHTKISQTQDYLAGMIASGPDTDDFLVEQLDAPGLAIGKVGFWKPNEVGLFFHPSVWGQGLATEALETLLPRQFTRHPSLSAVIADVDPRNTASCAVFRKLGFIENGRAEKTYLSRGGWADSLYLSLPRPADQDAGTIRNTAPS